jgi:hypothetical protein
VSFSASRTFLYATVLANIISFSAPALARAQESSSKSPSATPDSSAKSGGPSEALRDVLSAACAQDQASFVRFLTERNKEAFDRLTPSARVALMKRFVLLNLPGKAAVSTNSADRPVVRCTTPDVTTEMQIGGADLRDNVAFLPLEIRSLGDPAGDSVHQANMGFVRENGQWKLLSLGLLLLDLPALEVEWDAQEVDATERTAIAALKKIAAAVESYRRIYARLPESLSDLGPPTKGAPGRDAADFLDASLASGTKNGYAFRYVIVGANATGAPAKFEISAIPSAYGRTGRRSFFRDSEGGLHGADRQGAVGSVTDPKVD